MNFAPSLPAGWVDRGVQWGMARVRSQRWLWLLPLVVLYAMVRWPPARIVHVMGAVVALGVVAWAIRRPGRALIALVIFLPLQLIGFGFLLRLPISQQVVKAAGGLKELLVVGILLSALHALHVGRTRRGLVRQLDRIDKAALAYVAMVTVYMLVPHLFTSLPVAGKWSVRLLAWRADCGYVVLFFAARHAPISAHARRRFVQVLTAMAGLIIVVAFYQWFRPDSWATFVAITGRQLQYQIQVLGNDLQIVTRNLGYLTDRDPLRVGSIFLGPFDMADFLLIPFAVAVERITRGDRSLSAYLLGAGILAALFASRVRADALAAMVVGLVALAPAPKRPITARLRLLGAIVLATLIVVPSLGGTRFVNAQGGAKSNQGHITELSAGLSELIHYPLGLGIGNTPGVGDRFVLAAGQKGAFTVDNAILQVGDELGVQTLLPWLLLVILTWVGLSRAARRSDSFAGGVRLAFLAIFVAGMYHHVFLSFPIAWVLWAAIGLALNTGASAPGPAKNGAATDSERSESKIAAIQADVGRS